MSRFHWIFVFGKLVGMTVSVGNASSKRFQMETNIKSKSVKPSISPSFFLKDEGVRSQKGIWTHHCNDVLHTYLDFMRHNYPFVNIKCIYIRIHVFWEINKLC